MSKRKRLRRYGPGRFSKPWSPSMVNSGRFPPKHQMRAELGGKLRYESEESQRIRDQKLWREYKQFAERYGLKLPDDFLTPDGILLKQTVSQRKFEMKRQAIIDALREWETSENLSVLLEPGKFHTLWMHWTNDYQFYLFREVDVILGFQRKSILYKSRARAMQVYRNKCIVWAEKVTIPD